MTARFFLEMFFGSMIPMTGIKITIPYFLSVHPEIPLLVTVIVSLAGYIAPAFFLLWFFPRCTEWLHEHLAPGLNRSILHLHDVFVKNNRLNLIYAGIVGLIVVGELILWYYQVKGLIWYITIPAATLLWAWIISLIAKKIYNSTLNDTSIIHWFYSKMHAEHSEAFYRWGSIALIIIVAIPLPGTGIWGGTLLAYLFRIPYWRALGLLFIGAVIEAIIILSITTGIINGIQLL